MKNLKLRKEDKPETHARITNDTVEEHRKRILAGGRKFKYPLQYSKHKLVINTIIISLFALLLVVLFGWWQLYKQQSTSAFAYRVTSVIPLPVANVDGVDVRYSDYLLRLRPSERYRSQKEATVTSDEDTERQINRFKQQSMYDVSLDAYAGSIAKQQSITVSDEELNALLNAHRQIDGSEISERTLNAVIRDFYEWTPEEYRQVMHTKLLRQKVAFVIDTEAKSRAEATYAKLKAAGGDASWGEIARADDLQYGRSGMVPKANQDGGLASAAANLKIGEMSGILQVSPDSQYNYAIVRLVEKNDTHVNYEFITIPVTKLRDQFDQLYQDGKIKVYIDVPLKEEDSV